jgi:hypothetical protein
LSICKFTVAIAGLWAPTTARKGDTALMDEFTIQDMPDTNMKDINRYSIYL